MDLFAGPGRYDDGTQSTPLLILEMAIKTPKFRDRLVTIFNDKDEGNTNSLQQAINEHPGIETLKYKPLIHTDEIGEKIVKMFEKMKLVPTLFFVDPWGYKGLSLRLVNSVIKDWGCDCIFFFNYNRINMGLSNPMVKNHMDCLFGVKVADELRKRLAPLNVQEREVTIVEELCHALKELGAPYVLPFRFRDDSGKRTMHHLIFVSKGFKGYEIMKEIMAKESSSSVQGVSSFEYCSASSLQPFLFQLSSPLEDLENMLIHDFSGTNRTMRQIYELHSVGRPYLIGHYKKILIKLEEEGKITASKHRKNTFADDVVVSFPLL